MGYSKYMRGGRMHGGVKVATSASADLTCWRGAVEWVGGGWVGVGWYRCVCVWRDVFGFLPCLFLCAELNATIFDILLRLEFRKIPHRIDTEKEPCQKLMVRHEHSLPNGSSIR